VAWRLTARLAGRDHRFIVTTGEHLLGSADDCDIRLPDPTVSRRHARLHAAARRLTIEDLASRNGVSLDGHRISGIEELRAGSVLALGDVRITVEAVDEADLPSLRPRPGSGGVDGPPAIATTATAPRIRFCTDALPRLIGVARGDPGWHAWAGEVLAALVGSGAGGASLADDGRLVVECGRCEGPSHAVEADRLRLVVHAAEPDGLAALAAVARLALDLLLLGRRSERAAAPAAREAAAGAMAGSPVELLSRDPGFAELLRQADIVASSGLGVLIEGETGTGKELLARRLHAGSGLPRDRFVAVNCAAIPRDLIDAELFGIEAGVATGVGARPGKFEQADGGTLFLDEIADMAAETQARLLRVLQEGEVWRIGANRPRSARARIIAACNRPLRVLVDEGRFRLDLYHRIADWTAVLPPLRERGDDVLLLANRFLERATRARGIRHAGWSRSALDAIRRYPWPGNVRELEREMARVALFLNDGEIVEPALLKDEIREAAAGEPAPAGLESALAAHERRLIEAALRACDGQVGPAAERLGIGKSTLYRRIDVLGIRRPGA
jgi:DNA-binding NtrC family response regulator